MKSKKQSMMKFSPALGLIFGSSIGSIIGLLTNNSLALFAGTGSGLGLVIGAIVNAIATKKALRD